MLLRPTPARAFALALSLLLTIGALVAFAVARGGGREATAHAGGCPPGWTSREQRERLHAREVRYERLHGGAGEREGGGVDGCVPRKHPESVGDIAAVNAFRSVRQAAPFSSVAPGAYTAAVSQRDARAAQRRTLAGTGGAWKPAGQGPLIADDERYPEVNGLGLADLNGRVTDFAYDAKSDRVYASVGEGGVWTSDDQGGHWRSSATGWRRRPSARWRSRRPRAAVPTRCSR